MGSVRRGQDGERLASAEERRLLVSAVRTGDKPAVERLLGSESRWISAVARQYANARVGQEELVQVGRVELWRAIERFDLRHQVRLRTYAESSVVGAIRRTSRTQHLLTMTVGDATAMARVAATRERLAQELGANPREEEVAAELELEPAKVSELARAAEGLLDLDALAEGLSDSALTDEIPASDSYGPEEVKALVEGYAELRARLTGSREERPGKAQTVPRRPGTAIHLRLLDLEGALNRLPGREFQVLELVGLERLSKRAAAKALKVSERTVYSRYEAAVRWLTQYLNQPDGQPPLRGFRFALDPDPLRSLCDCVRRHKALFDQLARLTAVEPRLEGLRVTWLPAKNTCVPVISNQDPAEGLSVPLTDLLAPSL